MECPKCGVEVRINKYSGFKYQPFDKNLWSWNKGIEIPFYCKSCGAINFPYKPIRDVVFIYPYPRPEKVGSIYLPQDDEYYRSSVNDLFESKGVVLAVGKYMYSSGEKISQKILKVGDIVLFEKRLPKSWKTFEVEDTNGEIQKVIYCGLNDIYCKVIK